MILYYIAILIKKSPAVAELFFAIIIAIISFEREENFQQLVNPLESSP